MSKRKPLRIGMIGYGFMGRAHSNAYRRVNNFFDLEYEPVLQAVCARDEAKAQAVCRYVGLRIGRNRLAEAARAEATSTRSTSACRTICTTKSRSRPPRPAR